MKLRCNVKKVIDNDNIRINDRVIIRLKGDCYCDLSVGDNVIIEGQHDGTSIVEDTIVLDVIVYSYTKQASPIKNSIKISNYIDLDNVTANYGKDHKLKLYEGER